ncbi:MAG: UpxY family transcription antiterminator [Alistipes timonensis]|nr:UpxY family transcription antiterminator [Alistipes timonensis]
MENNLSNSGQVSGSEDVGNAGGVPGWFVVCMRRNNTEKASAERLRAAGFECYVATQREVRCWRNGKKKLIDRVVIPSIIFIRCSEAERRVIVGDPCVSRFMMDKAANTSRLAVVPDSQIERMRFMLGQSDIPVEFVAQDYKRGDKVRVARGGLKGLEGEVIGGFDGKSDFIVSVDCLGNARLRISTIDLEPVN